GSLGILWLLGWPLRLLILMLRFLDCGLDPAICRSSIRQYCAFRLRSPKPIFTGGSARYSRTFDESTVSFPHYARNLLNESGPAPQESGSFLAPIRWG